MGKVGGRWVWAAVGEEEEREREREQQRRNLRLGREDIRLFIGVFVFFAESWKCERRLGWFSD